MLFDEWMKSCHPTLFDADPLPDAIIYEDEVKGMKVEELNDLYGSVLSRQHPGLVFEKINLEDVPSFTENLKAYLDQATGNNSSLCLEILDFLFRECGAILAGGLPNKLLHFDDSGLDQNAYKSDLDLYLTCQSNIAKAKKALDFYNQKVSNVEILPERRRWAENAIVLFDDTSSHCITFSFLYRNVKIPEKILSGFDMQNSMVGFNYETMWKVQNHHTFKNVIHWNPSLYLLPHHERLKKIQSQGLNQVSDVGQTLGLFLRDHKMGRYQNLEDVSDLLAVIYYELTKDPTLAYLIHESMEFGFEEYMKWIEEIAESVCCEIDGFWWDFQKGYYENEFR